MEYRGIEFQLDLATGMFNLTRVLNDVHNLGGGFKLVLHDFMRRTYVVEYMIKKSEELSGTLFEGELVRSSGGIMILDKSLVKTVVLTKKGKGGFTLAEEGLCKLLVDAALGTRSNNVKRMLQQECCLKTIEQITGVVLLREYRCAGYRIDGYDKVNNIAYEIDEPQHRRLDARMLDMKRMEEIKAELGCEFKRILL